MIVVNGVLRLLCDAVFQQANGLQVDVLFVIDPAQGIRHGGMIGELLFGQRLLVGLFSRPQVLLFVRRTAWESQTDAHLAFKNTLASNLTTSIKQNVFAMRVRQYNSTLEASLFENNVQAEEGNVQ